MKNFEWHPFSDFLASAVFHISLTGNINPEISCCERSSFMKNEMQKAVLLNRVQNFIHIYEIFFHASVLFFMAQPAEAKPPCQENGLHS